MTAMEDEMMNNMLSIQEQSNSPENAQLMGNIYSKNMGEKIQQTAH